MTFVFALIHIFWGFELLRKERDKQNKIEIIDVEPTPTQNRFSDFDYDEGDFEISWSDKSRNSDARKTN